jgi:hypothetical protein
MNYRCNKCRQPIDHEGWCVPCDITVHPPAPFKKRVLATVPEVPKFRAVEEKFVAVKEQMTQPRKRSLAKAKK